jgi:hypothetical protein
MADIVLVSESTEKTESEPLPPATQAEALEMGKELGQIQALQSATLVAEQSTQETVQKIEALTETTESRLANLQASMVEIKADLAKALLMLETIGVILESEEESAEDTSETVSVTAVSVEEPIVATERQPERPNLLRRALLRT